MDEVEKAFNALTKEVFAILDRGCVAEIAAMDTFIEGNETLQLVVEACRTWERK